MFVLEAMLNASARGDIFLPLLAACCIDALDVVLMHWVLDAYERYALYLICVSRQLLRGYMTLNVSLFQSTLRGLIRFAHSMHASAMDKKVG